MKTILKKTPGASASQFIVRCIIDVSSLSLKLPKATITRCDLSPRFFCISATLLCEFESDKI